MSQEEDEYKKRLLTQAQIDADEDSEDESGESGSGGGASGEIEFVDFLSTGDASRDDLLPDEVRRLLSVHENVNKENVKKQKDQRDTYKNLKEGKQSLEQYRNGLTENASNGDKPPHPILSNKAQFSGIDSKVNPSVTENNANTNEENRNEAELRYSLQHKPENAPRFNPKPTPYR